MQEGITVEALLDSEATGLVMSSEFARKQGFKLKKLERPMQVRNVDVSGAVHTGVEVHRMDSGMSRLVEQPWLQLMCCAVCLPHGRNFR